MINFVYAITLSYGWKRRAIAFSSGAFGALALAPVDFWPAMLVPLVVSVWLLDGVGSAVSKKVRPFGADRRSLREATGIGWWLGFGYFLAGLWWLGAAFLVEAADFAWALPFGVAGLPAILACFTAAGFGLARFFWCAGSSRILALALSLGIAEWLRGVLFTGFPWNAIGMAFGGNLVLAQTASLVGLNGLTFLAILVFASPATLADVYMRREGILTPALMAGIALLSAMTFFGTLRLWQGASASQPGVRLRIMQPNTPQDEKFRPENGDAILTHYLELSDRATTNGGDASVEITHLIWPESAFPFFLAREAQALSRISGALGNRILVTGAARMELIGAARLPGEIAKVAYYNAVQVLGRAGMVLDTYDKVHLVPFGEYLPFSGLLESIGLRHFVHIPGGFEPGAVRKLLDVPGLPGVFPLVCYEAVFPGVLDPQLRRDAGMLINVTNDGWFGMTAGPHQHLAQSRLRAVEEGLPIVRAANTGISAIIDPYGRFIGRLPLGVEGVLDGNLPAPIASPLFARWPIVAPLALFLLGLLALLVTRLRR